MSPMQRAIGPLDARLKISRCTACIKGHLKCQGGPPCRYCVRTKQVCTIPKRTKQIVFLGAAIQDSSSGVPRSVALDAESRYFVHFNTVFLDRFSLTGIADQFDDVMPLLRKSRSLQHAVMAVSALELERRAVQLGSKRSSAALQYYRAGISCIKCELCEPDLRINTSVLWSTFFLGLFELMCDSTGDGWIKHFLHGTSAILQYRGAEAHLDGAGRRFFLTVRIFEISRVLIYSSESFLARSEWCEITRTFWSGGNSQDWHPREALFDLMLCCATLHTRAIELVHQTQASGQNVDRGVLQSLAEQGLLLQSSLFAWREAAETWSIQKPRVGEDLQMTLALVYNHAISIYLSGIFDYYQYWTDQQIHTPTLSSSDIQAHVSAILRMVGHALKHGTLAGILFFFPIRVAGARARTRAQQDEISRLLHQISNQGYAVANAFVTDLEELWTKR